MAWGARYLYDFHSDLDVAFRLVGCLKDVVPRLLVPVVGDQDEAADVGPERIGRAGGQKDAREEGPCAGHFFQ